MASIQHVIPLSGYLNETGILEYAVPGSSYINEGVALPPPPVNASTFVKRTRFYNQPVQQNWFYLKQRARTTFSAAPPIGVPLPYTDRRKIYFPAQQAPVGGAHRFRRSQARTTVVTLPVFFDGLMRQVLVSGTSVMKFDGLVRQILVKNTAALLIDGVMRQALVTNPPLTAPYPVFPGMSEELSNALPVGFPIKVRPTMSTIVNIHPWSAREMRYAKQPYAVWEFDLTFEQLKDQTQNQIAYSLFIGLLQYQQLVQQFLMHYGKAGLFLFDAPWDDSRLDQLLGIGDGSTYIFTATRSWGHGTAQSTEPVGAINQVTNVKINGVTVNTAHYRIVRNKVIFQADDGTLFPPANGAVVTMTFSFYYLCRFVNNDLDFEMFFKNRWMVKTLTIRNVIKL